MNCAWNELIAILPPQLRAQVDRFGRDTLQEIRMRVGTSTVLERANGRLCLPSRATQADLRYVVNMACGYSPWTAETVADGYITVAGGHRIGLCGQALCRGGVMTGVGELTSLNIRVARDFPGISGNLWLHEQSLLVLGPPGSGKTTLLRDLIRKRASRENVAVVDERGELFPPKANFDRGIGADVLGGCGKRQGIEALLRTMAPACIAVDEVTAEDDCRALIRAGKCGVHILATAHAVSVDDLHGRPIYGQLLKSGLFDRAVVLRSDKSWRTERIDAQ